jgi:hypothetical protein
MAVEVRVAGLGTATADNFAALNPTIGTPSWAPTATRPGSDTRRSTVAMHPIMLSPIKSRSAARIRSADVPGRIPSPRPAQTISQQCGRTVFGTLKYEPSAAA